MYVCILACFRIAPDASLYEVAIGEKLTVKTTLLIQGTTTKEVWN